MRIDYYTTIVLTIIAVCLVWFSVGRLFVPGLHAQQPWQLHMLQGSEIGYRIDQLRPGEAPTGTLVVQIDGLWYEVKLDYRK